MKTTTKRRPKLLPSIDYTLTFFRSRKHPWRRIWASVLLKTGMARWVNIRMDGYRIHLSDSQLAISSFINKSGRKHDERFLSAVLRAGDVYVDVGANIGTLVLKAASILKNTGVCIGIEAHPETYKHLEQNVRLNPFSNIKLICSAIGKTSGSLTFSDSKYDDVNKVLDDAGQGIEVPVQKLDTLLDSYPAIALLKIDVEGYEKMVLEGGLETLKKTAVVYFESCEAHFTQFGYDTGDVIALLERNGFHCFKVSAIDLHGLNADYSSTKVENLVALKDQYAFAAYTGFRLNILEETEEVKMADLKTSPAVAQSER